jgi:hypothetical protein
LHVRQARQCALARDRASHFSNRRECFHFDRMPRAAK